MIRKSRAILVFSQQIGGHVASKHRARRERKSPSSARILLLAASSEVNLLGQIWLDVSREFAANIPILNLS